MIFGERIVAPDTAPATAWLDAACRTEWWTVGALVPNDFDAHLRIWLPPDTDDFWEDYRELHRALAAVGERYTSTPGQVWFAIWDGHGFGMGTTSVLWGSAPADDAERQARAAEVARLRAEDAERAATVRAGLASIPTIDRPHRRYHVVSGPVEAVADLREPGGDAWLNPDLWWPEDRAWFVATDVDFWSLYVAGTSAFAADVIATVPAGTRVEPVDLDSELEIEN